jgi:putative Holliday junction resolvase
VPYCETVPQPVRVQDETCLGEVCPPKGRLVRPGARLAVDVGTARIGVAACDPAGLLASPLTTVRRGRGDLAQLARLAAEREVTEVIVGLPRGLSGRESGSAADARGFAAALADLVAPVPVRLVDERFTTVLAHDALRQGGRDSRARRTVVDQAAAALLLQTALDTERSTGQAAGELVTPAVRPAPGGAR